MRYSGTPSLWSVQTAPKRQVKMNKPIKALTIALLSLITISAGEAVSANKLIQKPIEAAKKKLGNFKKDDKAPKLREKWALLVSLDSFHDKSIEPIKFAQNNALLMAGLLANPELGKFGAKHVLTVTNKKAIKPNIEKCLSEPWLLKHALPKDLVLLYFCTRYIPTDDGEDIRLCFYETEKTNPDAAAIKLKETLKEIKRRTQSPYIVSILDISPANTAKEIHKDEINSSSMPTSTLFQKIAEETGTTIIAGNVEGMESYHSSIDQSSFLVANLIEGFKAGSGQIDLKTIADYVINNVKGQVEDRKGRYQKPVFALASTNSEAGDVIPAQMVKSSQPKPKIRIGHPLKNYPELAKRELQRQQAAQKIAVKPRENRLIIEEKNWHDEAIDDSAAPEDVDFGPYMKKMKRTIQAQWNAPKGFKARSVVAVFSIRRDGAIVNPEIVDGSGVPQVDESAMQALKSAKLDPLPRGAPPYVQIRYQFNWKVSKKN